VGLGIRGWSWTGLEVGLGITGWSWAGLGVGLWIRGWSWVGLGVCKVGGVGSGSDSSPLMSYSAVERFAYESLFCFSLNKSK